VVFRVGHGLHVYTLPHNYYSYLSANMTSRLSNLFDIEDDLDRLLWKRALP